MSVPAAACALAALVAASSVRAAQPLATDDAAVVDPKTCQLEAWVGWFHDHREYWLLPACNPFDNLELTAGGARTESDDAERSSLLQVQAKTVLIPRGDGAWSFGSLAGALRDTGAPHGGSAFQAYYGKALASYYPSDALEIDLNLGVADGYRVGTYALAGAALQYTPVERFQLLGEVFRATPGPARYQAGVRLALVPERFEVYASYGNRFGSGSADWWATVGIRVQTEPFLP